MTQKISIQLLAMLLAALLLAGCVTKPTRPDVTTVYVKVKEPCIEQAPQKPLFLTGKGEWPGDKAAAGILAADFEAAERWGTAWEAAAAGCLMPKNGQ